LVKKRVEAGGFLGKRGRVLIGVTPEEQQEEGPSRGGKKRDQLSHGQVGLKKRMGKES